MPTKTPKPFALVRQHYTEEQIDILLNMYYRDHVRPAPYPAIAAAMGVQEHEGLDDLVWKITTGYNGRHPTGPRRVYVATDGRVGRAGWAWLPRDDAALRGALAGEGQLRDPKCDMAYIAAVLARSVEECEARWAALNADVLGREGFGL